MKSKAAAQPLSVVASTASSGVAAASMVTDQQRPRGAPRRGDTHLASRRCADRPAAWPRRKAVQYLGGAHTGDVNTLAFSPNGARLLPGAAAEGNHPGS
jgi:hypothetical protein